jgi:dual specificity protein kinase YAK1
MTLLFCSDESLLQEDSSLSADLSGSLHLGDATGQGGRSTRSSTVQGRIFAASNLVPANQRYMLNFPQIDS